MGRAKPGVSMARRHAVNATVIGAGNWGTTVGKILADGGSNVTMWARRPEVAREITEAHRNSQYLPGINLPRNMVATSDLAAAVRGADQIYLSVPSQSVREMLRQLAPLIQNSNAPIVSLIKGVEKSTGLRISEVVEQELDIDQGRFAVLSGPNIALEICKEFPTAAVVASTNLDTASAVARVANAKYFRSYISDDVVGTEFGGVLKNLIAVAIGISNGAGYGDNTKASIVTRGLVEMTDFAVAFGAKRSTMQGLAGLGDLIATCESPLSRNNTAGRLLGQGLKLEQVVTQMHQTAEGLASVTPILQLAKSVGVSMPIVEQVKMVMDGKMKPKELGPHLTTDDDDDVPRGERNQYGKANRGGSFWRAIKRTFG